MDDKKLVDHLLIDRFIITNDYIGNSQSIGYIFSCSPALTSYYERFTANFRKLEWWEERKITEWPFYLKTKAGNSIKKVSWIKNNIVCFDNGIQKPLKDYYPATEAEWIKYSKKVTEEKIIEKPDKQKHLIKYTSDNLSIVITLLYILLLVVLVLIFI